MRAHIVARVMLIITFIIFWLAVLSSIVPAQAPAAKSADWGGPFHYGYVLDSVRTPWSAAWDTTNAYQVERGGCIEPEDITIDTTVDRSMVLVALRHITKPLSVNIATPYQFQIHCTSRTIGTLHVHTPTTCMLVDHKQRCFMGGMDAYLCMADEADKNYARAQHDYIMVIQCDRNSFIFFFPGKRG